MSIIEAILPLASVFGYASAYFMAFYMDMDIAVLTVTKVSVTWYCAWACFVHYPELNKKSFGLKRTPLYSRMIMIGMLFCGAGDVFLELEPWYPNAFFLCGLISFFLGHLLYICAFTIDVMPMKNAYKTVLHDSGADPKFIGCYAYAVFMCWYLMDGIPSGLVIPVIMYAFTIASMGYTALKRIDMPNSSPFSQKAGAIGAAIFVLSDTILAINKFSWRVPYGKWFIMLTYYFAQICISMSCFGGGRGTLVLKKKKK